MKHEKECKISYYQNIKAQKVDWLWYPYIPYGKITLLQGDPGEGKTSFALKIASMLSKGEPLPDGSISDPLKVIYQSAEDSAADTIKPRLELFGADCNNIAFILDDDARVSLKDHRLRDAICYTQARLLILDPLQAFIPDNCDMGRASDMRESMGYLASIAAETNCAVIIIGHMTKSLSTKGLYRGIGSIDIAAIARSILMIGHPEKDTDLRTLVHIKSNLAPLGKSINFCFGEKGLVYWDDSNMEYTIDDIMESSASVKKRIILAEDIIGNLLGKGAVLASDIYMTCQEKGISKRTADRAKKSLQIESFKSGDKWYWRLG